MAELQVEQPEQLMAGQIYYRAYIRQLTPEESGGRQNIFIDIIGLEGKRQSQERFVIFTNDQEVANIAADKPPNEPYGADVPMYPGNTYAFRPWTFVGDNVGGFEHGTAFEVRWVAEQVVSEGAPDPFREAAAEPQLSTETVTPNLAAQVEKTLQDLEALSAQVRAMQARIDEAIAEVSQLKQSLKS
jgi:hypothetical protein